MVERQLEQKGAPGMSLSATPPMRETPGSREPEKVHPTQETRALLRLVAALQPIAERVVREREDEEAAA